MLILNDLGITSSPGFAEVDQAIFAGLQAAPYQIELYYESLELTLFPDETSQKRFREEFIRKYSSRRPDVIIAAGSGSFKFIAESDESFLRDIPIIFCAILAEIPKRPIRDLHFTGVLGRLHPEETLHAALELLPRTKHVVVTGGMGKFDESFEAIAKQGFQNYESKLEFTYLTQLTMPALLEQLKHLPSDTIVYHTAITRDAAGQRFIDSAQSVPLVASAANAPVFVMDDVDLREGAVGGDLVNWADDGRVAAEMAVRVLNGERPEDIPIVTSKDVYMFNWRALQRWGLKESALPSGSIVLNRQPTFWQLYKKYVISGIVILLVQTVAIFALLWQRAKRRKTEAELVTSNEQLRSAMGKQREVQDRLEGIITSAMDAVVAVDEEQKIVVFNAAAEKMFGCLSQDALETRIDRFIPQRFRGLHGGHIERFGESGTTNRIMSESRDLWALRANGQEFPIESSISQIQVGRRKLFTVIVRDISDRKEAEEARFRHAVIRESSQDAIISLDLNGLVLSWNVGAQRMYGYSEEEMLGRSLNVMIPQELQAETDRNVQRVKAGERIEHYETLRLNNAGLPVDVSVTMSPLRDWAGKIVGVSEIASDITLRKRAEAALRESEERFRLVANTAPVMIWMAGVDRLCNYVNQQFLAFTGRSFEEELGSGWVAGIFREDAEISHEAFIRAFDRREPFEIEFRLRRHDGEYRWVFDLGVPRFNADGSFAGYIGSCIDVTERKLAEEALSSVSRKLIEAHEEERTWIARELHDDINQRLALLAVNLDALKGELPVTATDSILHIADIKQQAKELGIDVQALSHRLHSSKLEYLGLTAAAAGFCREFSERKGVHIEFHSDIIPKSLPGEISLCLFRVLQEGLQNAAKHSGSQDYKVSITLASDGVHLTVEDSGCGFDMEEALKTPGIGITSMKERLKIVNGELRIDSQTNRGTAVHARVPFYVNTRVASGAATA